jgi:uncharacterized repeat protein (TIGR01451 family)
MPGTHRRPLRRARTALHVGTLLVTLALVFGQLGLAAAGAIDRDRDGSFSSETDVVSTEGGSSGADQGEDASGPRPLSHGGSSIQVNFQAADPGSYNHTTGAPGAGFTFANSVSTLNGGDFSCGDIVAFMVEVHVGDNYGGAQINGFGYSLSKDTTGQPGAGYTSVGAPTLLTGDPAYDDDGTAASITNVSIGSTATTHTLSFNMSGVDGDDGDGSGDTIIFRFNGTLGCTPGSSPTGQIQASQTGIGGNDTVNLNVAGLPIPPATGTITVNKVLVPNTDPGKFELRIDGALAGTGDNVGDGGTTGAVTVSTGSHTVSEVAETGTSLGDYTTTIECHLSGSPAGTPTAGTSAQVTVGANENWICTITNTRAAAPTGTITVNKVLSPNTDPGLFDLRIDGAVASTGNDVGDGGTTGAVTVSTGNHTVSEVAGTGTSLGDYSTTVECHLSGSPAGTPNSATQLQVTVGAGENWVCTFTNTRLTGTITVNKVLSPNTDPGLFDLRIDGAVAGTGNDVGDGGTTGAVTVNTGSHTVSEVAGTGTSLGDYSTTVECHLSGSPAGTPTSATQLQVTVGAGEDWVCTFTNTRLPTPPPPGTPALSILKTAGAPAAPGDPVTFSITVTSSGTATATGVTLSDTLPTIPGTTWSISGGSGAASCSLVGNILSCNFGDLDPGQSRAVTVSTTATTTASCGSYTNTATADATNTSPVSSTATARVDCPSGLDLVKSGPATAEVGDTITYTFTVTLTAGSPPISGVVVTDPICDSPPTLQSGDDGDGVLEQGETWIFTCTHLVTANDPDPLPNTATVSGGGASDSDNHEVDIIHPAIDIEKVGEPDSGSPGDEILYTYDVTNIGDVPLFDISVDDDVVGHICSLEGLAVGETQRCVAAFTIPETTALSITNIAIAVGHYTLPSRPNHPVGGHVEDQDTFTITIVAGETVTPPGGTAFTGPAAAIPLAGLALLMLTTGSGLLWVGRRRRLAARRPNA